MKVQLTHKIVTKKKRNCTKYENENLVRKMLIVNMKYYYQINT